MLCKHFLFGEKKNYTLICTDAGDFCSVASVKKNFFKFRNTFLP